jgi:hypothetical protein
VQLGRDGNKIAQVTQLHLIRQSYQKSDNNIFDVISLPRETARPAWLSFPDTFRC